MSILRDPKLIRQFLLAGKATLTLRSTKTGTSFTYRVSVPKDKDAETSTRFFVALMNGPDNESSYTYLGMVEKHINGLLFRLTRGSKITQDAASYKAFRFFFDHVITRGEMPACLEVRHAGRCCRCGRKLTTPESIDTGFGPECSAQLGIDWSVKSHEEIDEPVRITKKNEKIHEGGMTNDSVEDLYPNVVSLDLHSRIRQSLANLHR